ncbi:lysine--tRNA ligase, partial [Pseudoalteromonas ruthenica]
MTDQIQDENKLIAERRTKLDAIRENCSANGHPNSFRREDYTADLQAKFGDKSKEELVELNQQAS